jgi:hypothetical protein
MTLYDATAPPLLFGVLALIAAPMEYVAEVVA